MSTQDLNELNTRFGIAGQVTFKKGAGGLSRVDVGNSFGSAQILLQGAHLLTWAPRRQRPVIWLSRAAKFAAGKSVRGGVPVCWPWFGPHASGSSFPAHGFARTVLWDVTHVSALPNGATVLVFQLSPTDVTRAQWPHDTSLELRVTVGAVLVMDLVTRNNSSTPVTIGDALHTYFEISDVRDIRVHGLGGCAYLDKVDGGKRKAQVGPVKFDGETDRIYLESVADCLIDDPRWNRRIRISKSGSRSTVVWNPWIEKANKMGDLGANGYLDMVCVESTNAADDVVTIAPGASHTLRVRYGVEPL